MSTMELCELCHAESQAWLDYRPPAPIKLVQIGKPEHNSRYGQMILDTIRAQQDLIASMCARGVHSRKRGEERTTVTELGHESGRTRYQIEISSPNGDSAYYMAGRADALIRDKGWRYLHTELCEDGAVSVIADESEQR